MVINENRLKKICALENEAFLKEAYMDIMGRAADEGGMKTYLNALANKMPKERVILDLRVSKEGLRKNTNITGLRLPQVAEASLLAYEGPSFVTAIYLAVLGRTPDEGGMNAHLKALQNGGDKVTLIRNLYQSAEGQSFGVKLIPIKNNNPIRRAKNLAKRVIGGQAGGNGVAGMGSKQASISGPVWNAMQETIAKQNEQIAALQERIEVLEQEREQKMVDAILAQRGNSLTGTVTYKDFEDRMRGSEELIIGRLRGYNDIIQQVKKNNNNGPLFALDLGCGRGEWLRLLKEEYQISGLGVDQDVSMLSAIAPDIPAVEGDLLSFLRSAQSDSYDFITMFQVVEHLPSAYLQDALKEIARVLRKGGAVILETPNPENMIVGSCNFFFDPTHVRKLPPALLQIFVQSAGLPNSMIIGRNPYNAIDLTGIGDETPEQVALKQVAGFFNNCGDYAVVAYKD